MRTAPRKPTPFFLATESRPELRARARSALDKSDPSLEADCTVEMGENTQPAVRLIHRPTGLQASVEPRRDRVEVGLGCDLRAEAAGIEDCDSPGGGAARRDLLPEALTGDPAGRNYSNACDRCPSHVLYPPRV